MTLPATEAMDDPAIYLTAVVIYKKDDGDPVTRIECLSPSNKPSGSGYVQYKQKHGLTLQAGIVMVELDYLHETHPVVDAIPSYLAGDEDAHPYNIIITDPRPKLEDGKINVYGFGIDAPIPVVRIPLSHDDTVTIDFGAIYMTTYHSVRYFSDMVDYATEPINFQSYHQADRERIKARMQTVQETHTGGDDLERMPNAE